VIIDRSASICDILDITVSTTRHTQLLQYVRNPNPRPITQILITAHPHTAHHTPCIRARTLATSFPPSNHNQTIFPHDNVVRTPILIAEIQHLPALIYELSVDGKDVGCRGADEALFVLEDLNESLERRCREGRRDEVEGVRGSPQSLHMLVEAATPAFPTAVEDDVEFGKAT
jgi:hypothetical protein